MGGWYGGVEGSWSSKIVYRVRALEELILKQSKDYYSLTVQLLVKLASIGQ